jgi:hypothetical protein
MKKIISLVVCVLFVTLMFAQGNYTATEIEKAEKITQKMNDDLKLSPTQLTQIMAINLEVVKRLDGLMENNGNKTFLKSEVQSINSYRNGEMRKVLTPQQYSLLMSNIKGRNCN